MNLHPGDEKQSMIERGLTHSMVLGARVLDVRAHPRRPGQKLLIVEIDDYAVVAPCKHLGGDDWMIVTAYWSRKQTKEYLRP